MGDVEKWIAQLTSSNSSIRYEACEELPVAQSLPEHALGALELATSDPDPQVADAAKRALTTHTPQTQEGAPQSAESTPLPKQVKKPSGCLITIVLVAIAGIILLASICSSGGGGDWTRWENCMATEEAFARDWGLTTNRAACGRLKP